MQELRRIRMVSAALLASSAMMAPALAAVPAPRSVNIDDNGVDLTTGLAWLQIEEGGIGSGPGRVAMQRIWAEGAGWVDNWSGGMFDITTGSITKTYVEIAGTSEVFTKSGTTYTSDQADGSTLVSLTSGDYLYTASDGTTIEFDGNVSGEAAFYCPGSDAPTCRAPIAITQPSGLKFTLSWNFATMCVHRIGPDCDNEWLYRRLTSVSSSAGYSLVVNYLTGAPGTGTSPTLGWYQRTSVTFSNSANPPTSVPTITYSYPVSFTTDVTDPGGRTWEFQTDSNGNLVSARRPGSSSANISYTSATDGTVSSATKDGVTKSYSRAVSGNIATETTYDSLAKQTVTISDLTNTVPTSFQDELGRTTTYQYDANGRLTRITQPESNYAQFTYDGRGNIITTTVTPKPGSGLSNIVTSASYDATCTNANKCNQPNSATDARGNVTDYTYDNMHGGVLTVTQPAPTTGAVRPQTRFSYTRITSASSDLIYMLTGVSVCQTISSCTGTSDETKAAIAYNTNLSPTSVTRGDGTGTLSATTTISYDARGRVDTIDGPLSGNADTTKYRYDGADQLIGITSPDPDGAGPLNMRAMRLTYRPDGQVSKKELGTVTDQSDTAWASFATVQEVDSGFDSNNRPNTQLLSSGGTTYAYTHRSYDGLGRPDCTAVRMNPATWNSLPGACTQATTGSYGPDQISRLIYDAAGQVTQVQVGVGTSGAANERTLTYGNNGVVTSLTDGENNKTSYVYDGFDRPSQTQYPDTTKGAGTSSASDYEQLSYDAASNVISRRLRDGTSISYTYDNLNRVTLKTLPNSEPAVSYSYDLLNRVTAMSQPGYSMSFGYDALSRQTAENQGFGSLTRQFDAGGNLTRTTWWDGFYVAYDRLITGELSKIRENGATSGVGILASYSYDNLGNRTSLTYGNGVVQSYAHDPVSRLTTLTTDVAGTANDLTIGGPTTPITYSPASQIISAPRSNDVYAFRGLVNVNRNYASNGRNQYTVAGPASFTFDGRGNLTSDGTNNYTYSSENELKSATGGVSLYYDPLQRLIEYDTSVSTRFVYDGLQMAAEVDNPAGAIQKRYVWGDAPDELITEYGGAGTSSRTFVAADERGSIVARTDGTGALTNANTYDEYGIPGSANTGRFQYTGQAWLPELGMQYSKARFYSPTLGRFLQTDPIGYGDGPNWYAYTHNDPIDSTDPLGLEPPVIITGSLFGAVTIIGGSSTSISGGGGGLSSTAGTPTKPAPGHAPRGGLRRRDLDIIITGSRIIAGTATVPWFVLREAFDDVFDPDPLGESPETLGALRRPVCGCLDAGTAVATPGGPVPIERIKVGDLVLSVEQKSGKIAPKKVTALIRPGPKPVYEAKVRDTSGKTETFDATADHPWMVDGKGWIETAALKTGDHIETGSRTDVKVTAVFLTNHVERTYNLEVADWHTFMVGADHVIVHNECKPVSQDAARLGYKLDKSRGRIHGQDVYRKGNRYISSDVTGHIGGAWKMFELRSGRLVRIGTWNEDLTDRLGK